MAFKYKVKTTDSWSTIAKQNNLSSQQLMQANPQVSSLSTGMGITVPQYSGAMRGDSVLTGSYDPVAPVSNANNLFGNVNQFLSNISVGIGQTFGSGGTVPTAINRMVRGPSQVQLYEQQRSQMALNSQSAAMNAQIAHGVETTNFYNQRYGMTEDAMYSLATGLQSGTLPGSISVPQASALGITQDLLSMGYTMQNGFLIAPAQQNNTTQSGTYFGTVGLGGAGGLGGKYGAAGDKWVMNSQAAATAWRRRQRSGEEHLTWQERRTGKLNPEHQKQYDERFGSGSGSLVGFGLVNFGVGTG
ncbi:MAG: LysM domain-containing protein [Candidatus Obscuribacterales bacterium]|jgi:hypothetical protein